MFDIGMPEFMVIALVALIVLGPERLPEVMGKLGRTYKQLRTMSDQLLGEARAQLEAGMQEINQVSSTITNTWDEATLLKTIEEHTTPAPPIRVRHVPATLQAPESAAEAGPWVLAATQQHTNPDIEPRGDTYPTSPFALERRLPSEFGDLMDEAEYFIAPSLEGSADLGDNAPDIATVYELPAVPAFEPIKDLPLPEYDEALSPSETDEPHGTNGTHYPSPNGAAGSAAQPARWPATTALAERAEPVEEATAATIREQTLVDLYRQGGISLDRAAAFLHLSAAEFLERVQQGRSA